MVGLGFRQTAILLTFLTVMVTSSTTDGEEFGMDDLIKKYPRIGEALNRSITRSKLLKPAPVNKNNDTTFVQWIQHLKEGKEYIEKPKDSSLDIIRTTFLTVFEGDYGVEVSKPAKDCRARAFAFSYVGCNRPCDRLVDLFINCCSVEKIDNFPAWAMSALCCPEMMKKN